MTKAQISIKKYFSLSPKERGDAVWIILQILRVKLLIKLVPLKYYFTEYFHADTHNYTNLNLNYFPLNLNLFYKLLAFLPIRITCLEECMLVKMYAARYGLEIFINLGVKKENMLQAHAWWNVHNAKGFIRIN
ncbi:MAG: lasso peptide biosynthesis B2 protein [Bacteroidales bacterium]|nr:lasso peptide biosynthesis B2 protein [Bacteroidales bacterium]